MQIKFFKKEKNFKKGEESLWLHVNFYWKWAVIFVFVAAISSLFLGYFLFMKVNEEVVLSGEGTNPQVEKVKKERIDKVLLYFSLRAQKSNQIINSPAPVIDPSL
ncbi:hypothetical protein A2917_02730 [Candidatus Nomurabacteria bacterium RIFCSPLOWO2_01_FULL_42_17]|uniref:Polysaccharide chain length determinant N-terminal domain-containing protein n=1 Tax=Candidatus Nomurabacteria bacterium RIFCSPLOWO2_01_FULL_42_17 TaxID=1801780 RepID=A0A1F6XMS4_9BACT|nr:MAG: hypothetical protein A2917_02730 [Candidatus Nomurabacteria bacterium RIFCSPLOWO2_01_FULL_42_17]